MEKVYREIARDTARATGALLAQLVRTGPGSAAPAPLATDGPALAERFRREVILAVLADDPLPAAVRARLDVGALPVVLPASSPLVAVLGGASGDRLTSVFARLGDPAGGTVLHLALPEPPGRLAAVQAVARLAEGRLAALAARAEVTRGQHRLTDLEAAREVLAGLQVAGTQLMIEADEGAILGTVARELLRLGLHSGVLMAEPGAAPVFRWRFTSFPAGLQRALERIMGRTLAEVVVDPAGAPLVARCLEDGRTLVTARPRAAARDLLGGATTAQLRALGRLFGLVRLVLTPLRREGRTAGFLAVVAPMLRAGDPEAIEAFALQASVALEKARLVQALREERARLEAEVERRTRDLRLAVEALQETDRKKDNFLANVSHELRTPLVTVIGWADLLASEKLGELAPRQRQAVQVIGSSGRRLKGFIDELLDLSRHELTRDRLALSAFPAGELLRQAAVALTPRFAEHGLRLHVRLAPRLPDLWADRDRVLQVLVNLLSNADRHAPQGSVVRLAASRGRAGAVEVSVADRGPGIPPEHQARIFDRLYQVRDAAHPRDPGTGLGLGLAIARSIVEAHGGRIGVRSRVGRGTTFRFSLPTVERLAGP